MTTEITPGGFVRRRKPLPAPPEADKPKADKPKADKPATSKKKA